jgi:CRP-like cAMP-binding protein
MFTMAARKSITRFVAERDSTVYVVDLSAVISATSRDPKWGAQFLRCLSEEVARQLCEVPFVRNAGTQLKQDTKSNGGANVLGGEHHRRVLYDFKASQVASSAAEASSSSSKKKSSVKRSGTLALLAHHIVFYSKLFSSETSQAYAYSDLERVDFDGKLQLTLVTRSMLSSTGPPRLTLSFKKSADAHSACELLVEMIAQRGSSAAPPPPPPPVQDESDDAAAKLPLALSPTDWAELAGDAASTREYHRDSPIVRENAVASALYQVASGTLRVEQNGATLSTIARGEIFGELGFVLDRPASASVIADSDSADVHVLDATKVRRACDANPILASRFYFYTARLVAARLVPRSLAYADAVLLDPTAATDGANHYASSSAAAATSSTTSSLSTSSPSKKGKKSSKHLFKKSNFDKKQLGRDFGKSKNTMSAEDTVAGLLADAALDVDSSDSRKTVNGTDLSWYM